MKAVILVGGLATRLRPLTLDVPKAMVPVLNVPFLEHVLRRLGCFGINEIVLALSHLAPAVEGYFGNGGGLGLNIKYVLDEHPLGTGGAARNALGHIHEACLIMNGDIFTGLNISAMRLCHESRRAKVTIALTGVENPCAYGLVETRSDGGVSCFREKPSSKEITTNMINAGTYIVEPEVLAAIPPDSYVSFEREVFPDLIKGGEPVYTFADKSYWIDIGTPAKYHQLNRDLLGGNVVPADIPNYPVGAPFKVHPSSSISGPVIIAKGSVIGENVVIKGPVVIGPDCQVHAGTIVNDSILWQNVVVGEGCVVEGSIVGNFSTLGAHCCLVDCVMGGHISLPSGYFQTGGQIWPGLSSTFS